jgi:PAS domain S-box-containing protein
MKETPGEVALALGRNRPQRTYNEVHFRRLLEGLPAAAYTCNREGLLTYYNPRAEQLWGHSPRLNDPSVRYGGALHIFAADGRELSHENSWMARAILEEREFGGQEVVIGRPDGSRVTVLAHASVLRDESGAVIGGVNVLVDIDERKRAQDIQKFLADSSVALAQIADYESTLERISRLAVPFFADWFGVHVREPGGKVRRMAVRHMNPDRERFVEELYRSYPATEGKPYGAVSVLLTGEPIFASDFEALLPKVARDERHLEMLRNLGLKSFLCVPMRSRGNIVGALTFATAESRRTYSEMHFRAAEELATRAAIAIENAHLLDALKEADRRKDEFLAMLAHELRNPLAPVRNAVQILRANSSGDAQAGWAHDVIDRQVQQMSRLVEDLLDVSRIARGKIELRRERVAIATAVSNAVEVSRPLIERARHELALITPPEPIHVEADVARLSQIFSNLLTNAAKYTDPGGRIAVQVQREGDFAAVRVSDTGIGIPPQMLSTIFDMFVQVERAGDHSQGGLGIGLTLVKRLAELHGGSVEARSAGVGHGSEFVVRLPICGERTESVGAVTGPYPMVQLGSLRILVVDDNRDAADSLAVLLRANGGDVRVAYDGLEAVGGAISFKPDVVLLDIGLPKLYGYDAARRIREARGKEVLLIAITGWGQEEDRRRAHEAGFDHHLTKPVQFEALAKILAKQLASRSR